MYYYYMARPWKAMFLQNNLKKKNYIYIYEKPRQIGNDINEMGTFPVKYYDTLNRRLPYHTPSSAPNGYVFIRYVYHIIEYIYYILYNILYHRIKNKNRCTYLYLQTSNSYNFFTKCNKIILKTKVFNRKKHVFCNKKKIVRVCTVGRCDACT